MSSQNTSRLDAIPTSWPSRHDRSNVCRSRWVWGERSAPPKTYSFSPRTVELCPPRGSGASPLQPKVARENTPTINGQRSKLSGTHPTFSAPSQNPRTGGRLEGSGVAAGCLPQFSCPVSDPFPRALALRLPISTITTKSCYLHLQYGLEL